MGVLYFYLSQPEGLRLSPKEGADKPFIIIRAEKYMEIKWVREKWADINSYPVKWKLIWPNYNILILFCDTDT